MSTRYGTLVLLNPGGPEQEFVLAKNHISLGRATTSDITLYDARISRSHAALSCSSRGVTLRDTGSSNGTFLNGERIERATIQPGDRIALGSQELEYRVDDPSEDVGLTKIDSDGQLEQTLEGEFLPVQVNETGLPSLVIFTGEKTWQVDLSEIDQVMIGRDEHCEVFIDSARVSRRHAVVRQLSGAFELEDLGSTNGVWLAGAQVDRHILQDGDGFQIGPARIVFKSGFDAQSLTLADEKSTSTDGRRTVVFLPGLMGSELWLGDERVWPNVRTIFTNPEIYMLPSDVPLEARSIVDEIVIVPNLIKQDQYNRFGDYLVEELNYTRDEDFFEFAYDWRRDVRDTAGLLGQFIENLPSTRPIIIAAHSLGTMVSRYYVEQLGGDRRIERLILMGGPHKGAVKGLVSMLVAPEVLPFGIMGERLRQIMMSFPSSYQILPDYGVGQDQDGNRVNFLEDESWLEERYLPLLHSGIEFRRKLRKSAGIPTTAIFGYGIKTISNVRVVRDADGKLQDVTYASEEIGDGSVLEQSAFLQGSEIHPVHQHHGALFVDNDVKMRLKLELTRPY